MEAKNKTTKRNPYLANNLKFIRWIVDLPQQYMADNLGINRVAYGYYESARSEPSLHQLKRIIEIFNSHLGDKKIDYNTLLSEKLDYLTVKRELLG
ncbi:MAG: helix-turn-helix transcriptional regulator [Acutalibacteraceae bacterium]